MSITPRKITHGTIGRGVPMFRKTGLFVLAWAVLLVAILAGCSGGGSTGTAVPSAPPSPAPGAASGPGADAGVRPPGPVSCTVTAKVDAVPVAAPGDVVCLTGDSDDRLSISTGGTDGAPITYSGGGSATVRGIEVTANNVVVEGFTSKRADDMGAKLQGDNITFRDNTISKPQNAGDDTDGLRFFGNGIQIVHNTISDVSDGSDCDSDGCGDGPHPDCMQTYYSDSYPTSSNVTIQGNRCENVAAQCLMAEGPVLPEDGINGPGESANWTFDDNYCDSGAAQALMIRNIKNLTITNNDFDGTNNKAIALADGSTGAHVDGNRVNPRIHKLITFDDANEAQGYVGPEPAE
jgi:hypothetical protein